MSVATLPPIYHVGVIRDVLQRERRMRLHYSRGTDGHLKVQEIDRALASLDVLAADIVKPKQEQSHESA